MAQWTMYAVVAKWEFDPANFGKLSEVSKILTDQMRAWPGIVSVIDVKIAPNAILSVTTYKDESAYKALIQDPNGPFEKAAKEHDIESLATWVWSERGEVL